MSDPITLPAPALTPTHNPVAAPNSAPDGTGGASFSGTLAALTADPAQVSAALPQLDPGPDPAPAPSADQAPALALGLPSLTLAGTRLPLTGTRLPLAPAAPAGPAGPADKAPAKPRSEDDAASATPTPLPDGPAAAPLAVLVPLPAAVPAPATPTTGDPARAALVANPPKALPRLPADAPPPAEPEAPRANPPRQAAAAAQVPLAGVQLRASFGAGNAADNAGGHDSPGDGRTAFPTTSEAALAPLAANPAPTPHLAALVTPDSAPAAVPTPTTMPAGQDLAALVDRLVEARGAAQAGSAAGPVSTTLTHADFGRVSVHFAPDAKGLNVTLSSTDPAFAGAAQAALSVGSASAGDDAQLFDGRGAGAGDSGRSTGASGFSGNGTGGNGGGSNGNPGPRADTRFTPAQSGNSAPPRDTTATPGSIFA